MLRTAIDQLMDNKFAVVMLVLAHVGALLWAAGLRKGLVPALVLNVIIAAGIVAYNAQALGRAIGNADWALVALAAFALVNLLVSVGALCRLRIPAWIVWILFGVDFILSLLLAAFSFLFRITMLF